MPLFTDQTGSTISLQAIPKRIVSLVPSQTELLSDLGLEEEVIGITKFCIHPNAWFRNKTRVGGTKTVSTSMVRQLQPDLVIANKEENVKEQVEALALEFPVWTSDINTLDQALDMVRSIGMITGRQQAAENIGQLIDEAFNALSHDGEHIPAAYLIWKDPYMTAGGDTFIHDMLDRAGFRNIFADERRYPAITIEQLKDAGCKLVLLSSEPFPFGPKHLHELQQQLPGKKILLADGEMFSWYGSRLLQAPGYFGQLRQMAYNV
jgi:ABC-type Fe3+-hydroxamate transport system substrate-binding protein